ncbi:MAG: zinc ribbon domain-containing protein [Nitrososphaerota archaeon]
MHIFERCCLRLFLRKIWKRLKIRGAEYYSDVLKVAKIVGYLVAYALPFILPSTLYVFLKPLLPLDILRNIISMVVIGVIVGLLSTYLCRDMLHNLLASIVASLLGLSTPLILMEIIPQLSWIGLFIVEGMYTLLTFIVLPLSASATSIAAYRTFMKKRVEVQKLEEKIETTIIEQPVKEEITKEEKAEEEKIEVTQETMPTISEESLRTAEEKLVPELEEMLKEIMKEEEEVVKEEKAEPVEKIPLKKCKNCGEYIPEDSIYCPLCGKYQGEES